MTPPPSPTSTSEGTGVHSEGTDVQSWSEEEDPCDAVKRVFTSEVLDEFLWKEGQPHQSLLADILYYVLLQTRATEDFPSTNTEDLLRHFGIKLEGRSFFNFRLRNLLPCAFRPAAPAKLIDVDVIKHLASVHCQENPHGGTGYSFGAVLERYLFLQLIYFHAQRVEGVQASIIGGDRRHINGDGNHETQENQRVDRVDGNQPAFVTLHFVRGTSLVNSGDGVVYQRVSKSLSDILRQDLNPDLLYLCHGTTMERASSIVAEGPNMAVGAACTDFVSPPLFIDIFCN